jgi:hypothetical protein
MRLPDDRGWIATNRDDDANPMLDTKIEMDANLVFRGLGGQIDGKWADGTASTLFVLAQITPDGAQPGCELLKGASILTGQGADHPSPAGLPHQIGPTDQEHGRADGRQSKGFSDRRID